MARGRWGKAGVRLSAAEARRNDLRRGHVSHARIAAEQEAYRQWEAGLLVPHRITLALDSQGLDGPEVDAACGAAEPDVDRWEAGELYPTWEQLNLLADLTGFPLRYFFLPPNKAVWSSMTFHFPNLPDTEPIARFAPTARTAQPTPIQDTLF